MTKLGKVGPYTLLERLGRGGMGEVYLASSRRGERVALKVLHDLAEDNSMRVRLEREVRALRRVESPYVAKVLDADLSCDRPYLVMENIEGATLLDMVRHSGPLNMAQLVELAQGIATALAIIHAAGVVHRDLKPANIIMGAEGPVLIDFGIAQVLDATRLTLTGTFLGTPGYTAPEIFADEHVDSPADIHAWAATVAFAATGRPTFGRGTAEAQMYAVLNGQADLKGVPVALLSLVRAALNREPGKRPTAALLADRLSRLAKATSPAEPDPARAVSAAEEGVAVRGRAGEEAKPRSRTAEEAKARSRTAEEVKPRSRTGEEAKPRGRTVDDGKVPAPRARTNADGKVPMPRGRTSADGKVPAPRGRTSADGKSTGPRLRTGEGIKPTPVRTRTKTVTGKPRTAGTRNTGLRSESGSTTLPAGNAALLLLAVLAVPCVVASVIWPIATIGITAAFVLLTRTLWMSHWMVRKRVSRRVRVTLRVMLFPFAFTGATATAVVWPGVPVAMAAGGALWLIGGGQIDADWWQQPAPVTAAGVVFGMLCGGITGREIERVGAHLPDLRREGLRALAVLGGFVALCAAAVRAIALLL
ncbi:serine/threonine-protein kinase [Nonomuraea aurantiaca]|uniref:serine/threonine-protein kinase n=1 Tax=Nonomuraea aurantiaca TaxID=2878562 RepID=UPI001CD9A0FB|nr:serine/threonine-protein kinase [Nonomuraea aurantiaca]MCA2229897.1 protein kinase [Nonomuraea aurantiaca]